MDNHRLPEIKGKLYGKYRGIVAVGLDPKGWGRIKVKVPAIFGFRVLKHWAYPNLPPQFVGFDLEDGTLDLDLSKNNQDEIQQAGSEVQPRTETATMGRVWRKPLPVILPVDPTTWKVQVGSGVWVEFEGGDADKPLWCGFWWNGRKGGGA